MILGSYYDISIKNTMENAVLYDISYVPDGLSFNNYNGKLEGLPRKKMDNSLEISIYLSSGYKITEKIRFKIISNCIFKLY